METAKQKARPFDEITDKENKRFAVEVIEKMKQEPKEFSCFVYEGQTLVHYKTGVGDFAKEVKLNRLERNRILASLEKVKQSDATRLVVIGKHENGNFAGKPTIVWCK